MKKHNLARLMKAIADDRAREWAEPDTPCPSEDALRGYHDAALAGVGEDEMSAELRQAAAHAFACKSCYGKLDAWLGDYETERLEIATAVLRERPDDVSALIELLLDWTQPGSVRAMAVDYLADLGGEQALVALKEAASNDRDKEVRNAAAAGLEELGLGTVKRRPIALFADIVSSEGGKPTDEQAHAIRLLAAILRDALKSHGGSEIKHMGDGLMARFESVDDALACASAMQRAADAEGAEGREAVLRVRVGLAVGEAGAEEEDSFGAAAQLAVRVCREARPGQVLASSRLRDLAQTERFVFADRGERRVEGFSEPVRIAEVERRGGEN